MKILTSNYNTAKHVMHDRFLFVSITRGKVPDWFPHKCVIYNPLRPSWDLVSSYKSGSIDWETYTRRYLEETRIESLRNKYYGELMDLSEAHGSRVPVLLCHCSGNCHRHIVAEMLDGKELIAADFI